MAEKYLKAIFSALNAAENSFSYFNADLGMHFAPQKNSAD